MKKIIYLSLIIILLGCTDEDKSDCSGVACTEEFKTITISIKDSNGKPIALNRFKVIILDSGSDITRSVNDTEFELMKQIGVYPLFGDENRGEYESKELEINFKGFIDNQEIVNSNYIVGADCCHVHLIEGNTDIRLE
jgi:hypothetical protein